MTSAEQPRQPHNEERTEMDRHEEAGDAVDVVAGEIGSAHLKEPSEVEDASKAADPPSVSETVQDENAPRSSS